MKKEKIIIYGKGDLAKLMLYYFHSDSFYEVVAFCVDDSFLDAESFCNLPLVSINKIKELYHPKKFKSFVAVGYSNMRNRVFMFDKIKSLGYECVNYISSKSLIDKSLSLGENNIILQGTIIEPFVTIRDNNIIWTSCVICHNTTIGSHNFIASQSLIGGFSVIKDNCFLGFNSTILQNVTIEDETLVGAKSLVLSNSEKFSKLIGIPAKKITNHFKEGIIIK